MDAQRYDLSKRRERTITIQTSATTGHENTVPPIPREEANPTPSSAPVTAALSWVDQLFRRLSSPLLVTGSSPSSSPASSCSSSAITSPTPLSPNSSTSSILLDREKRGCIARHENDTIYCTDVFERDGYTTTRTIIRPHVPVSIFSRSSSPVSVPSRPSSPIKFSTLSCIGSTDAFEEEVEHLTTLREMELNGENPGIIVRVQQESHVTVEERWRGAIQDMIHQRPVSTVIGGAEANY
ncbi:uncharacterized protein LACBIDRAFT_313246 [Laccaria bicolor S238N-H82]|uniref:Predicted protein n=1 Tax=Laccaria bicolor (strain S238N-H82 / ATCC MYA-4686) TaxID=486041 RepID=B0DXW0_LACBS|nr:uncharacterized protein LACBIDRAFT_313246 [Laccaria bicolor S238N-H82]EDR00533.1 predicted protein [Laccaria bicolor S238N-H82]|eukprot:XP_001888760.1 predicted protein [Laccaria bicolor S238N-H82]